MSQQKHGHIRQLYLSGPASGPGDRALPRASVDSMAQSWWTVHCGQEKPKKRSQSCGMVEGSPAGPHCSCWASGWCVWGLGVRGHTSVLIALGLVKASRPEPGHVTG